MFKKEVLVRYISIVLFVLLLSLSTVIAPPPPPPGNAPDIGSDPGDMPTTTQPTATTQPGATTLPTTTLQTTTTQPTATTLSSGIITTTTLKEGAMPADSEILVKYAITRTIMIISVIINLVFIVLIILMILKKKNQVVIKKEDPDKAIWEKRYNMLKNEVNAPDLSSFPRDYKRNYLQKRGYTIDEIQRAIDEGVI